jgi:diphthamide biosynthesis protein 7
VVLYLTDATFFTTMSSKILRDLNTVLHPCSIETLSLQRGIFACGFYELDESNEGTKRNGNISIFDSERSTSYSSNDCRSGVLDMKISGEVVAAAHAESTLTLYEFHDINSIVTDGSEPLIEKDCITYPEEGLFLSLDWDSQCKFEMSEYESTGASSKIAVSTQNGSLIVFERGSERRLEESYAVQRAHHMAGEVMPVWIVAFDCHSRHRLVSGGDDCVLRLWDIRSGTAPTASIKGQHDAGVTSAQWHPLDENIFATGSYDEHVRVWDHRATKVPLVKQHAGKISK